MTRIRMPVKRALATISLIKPPTYQDRYRITHFMVFVNLNSARFAGPL